MKKRMGNYKVDFKKVGKPVELASRGTGILYETKAIITGDIEIGVDIDMYTWKADWLKDVTFGDDAGKYRLVDIVNNLADTDAGEVNKVTATWRKI